MSSFESWTNIIGGILQHSGCFEFLGGTISASDELDPEPGDMAAFLAEVKEHYPNGFTVRQLVLDLNGAAFNSPLRLTMPELVAVYVEGKRESSVGLGKVFSSRKEVRFRLPADKGEIVEPEEVWLHYESRRRPIVWHVKSSLD